MGGYRYCTYCIRIRLNRVKGRLHSLKFLILECEPSQLFNTLQWAHRTIYCIARVSVHIAHVTNV